VAQSSTFRWVITLLTAVCIPMCCCSVDSLFGACDSCGSGAVACHGASDEDGCHDAAETEHAGDHDSTSLADHHSPTHKNHEDGCRCGSDKKIGTLEGKSQVSFQPNLLAYILPEPLPLRPLYGQLVGVRPDSRAPVRPDQSLLRQHCALIV
jgi:hypothetical protein